ncbi:cyclopropane-fatty-acyl-phospholipid synthase family protein [Streptomyces sp. NPDC006627]|uniref:cyclopropane-fatty-acyl-phospholipid synthase family protein n=1 Tax=Streptomyces sp. NPDC006627 TaxID=3154679 RepID=UPI0033B63375
MATTTGTIPFGASRAAIEHHYDVSNDFYALWLDTSMTYSCALWDGESDNLESAQLRKTDYHIAQARATGSDRVLDIGCGWGGLLRRLTEAHGVRRATGLTLSEAQLTWAQRHHDMERIEYRLESWTEHEPEAPYDAIISIGAIEHFASPALGRARRVQAYRDFFSRCHAWLRPGARLSAQAIVQHHDFPTTRQGRRDALLLHRVFPDSRLPALSELIEASAPYFHVVTVRNDPHHYARTCQAWLDRLRPQKQRATALVGTDKAMEFQAYLEACVRIFQGGSLGLGRIAFVRSERPVPLAGLCY